MDCDLPESETNDIREESLDRCRRALFPHTKSCEPCSHNHLNSVLVPLNQIQFKDFSEEMTKFDRSDYSNSATESPMLSEPQLFEKLESTIFSTFSNIDSKSISKTQSNFSNSNTILDEAPAGQVHAEEQSEGLNQIISHVLDSKTSEITAPAESDIEAISRLKIEPSEKDTQSKVSISSNPPNTQKISMTLNEGKIIVDSNLNPNFTEEPSSLNKAVKTTESILSTMKPITTETFIRRNLKTLKTYEPRLGIVRTPDRIKLERLKTAAPLLPARSTKPLTIPVEFNISSFKKSVRDTTQNQIQRDPIIKKNFKSITLNQPSKSLPKITIPESPFLLTRERSSNRSREFLAPGETKNVSQSFSKTRPEIHSSLQISKSQFVGHQGGAKTTVPQEFKLSISNHGSKRTSSIPKSLPPTNVPNINIKNPMRPKWTPTVPQSPNIRKPMARKVLDGAPMASAPRIPYVNARPVHKAHLKPSILKTHFLKPDINNDHIVLTNISESEIKGQEIEFKSINDSDIKSSNNTFHTNGITKTVLKIKPMLDPKINCRENDGQHTLPPRSISRRPITVPVSPALATSRRLRRISDRT